MNAFATHEKILGSYLTQDHSLHLLCGCSVDDPPYVINMLDSRLIRNSVSVSHLEFKQKKRKKSNDSSLRVNSPARKQFVACFICRRETRPFSLCSESKPLNSSFSWPPHHLSSKDHLLHYSCSQWHICKTLKTFQEKCFAKMMLS